MKDSNIHSAREKFRLIERKDALQILSWRNSPEVYLHTRSKSPIAPDVHLQWIDDRIMTLAESPIYIIENQDLLGMLRIDNFDNQEKEISIIVSPLYRNCGIGTKLLDFYFSRANNNSLTNYFAWIHVNNFGSIKLFTKFGFKIVSSENDFYLLFKDPIL